MKTYKKCWILLVVILLSGCSKTEDSTSSYRIGMSVMGMGASFIVSMVQGAEEEAQDQGLTLIVKDSQGDLEVQMDQIMDLIAMDVDALLIEPGDIVGLSSCLEKAKEAEIPVFCIDTGVDDESVAAWIASDNYDIGKQAADYIAELLYDRYGEYRGKVINLMASLTTTSGIQRSAGFMEAMEAYPDIEIVATQNTNLSTERALSVTSNLLQRYPQLDAIWCAGDNAAIGVIQAIDQAGRFYEKGNDRHIFVVSADGAEDALEAVCQGKMDMCISQNPLYMAKAAVGLIAETLYTGNLPEESFWAWPSFQVTEENVDSIEYRKYGIWSEKLQ